MSHDAEGRRGPTSLKAGYDRVPRVVTWEATRACDLACVHCRAEAQNRRYPGELDTDEAKGLLEQVAAFGEPSPVIVFSGGDPLKRPDLEELIRYATDLGLPAAVIPAPTGEVDAETVRGLRDAGTRRLALSLDGATAERHDTFRGEPGSFAAALEAAEHAAALDLPVQVNTTVTRFTAGDLPGIADLLEEMGAVMWEVFFLVPVGRGSELQALDAGETEAVLTWLYRRQRGAPFRAMTVEAPQYRRIATQIELEEGNRAARVGSTSDGNGFVFVSHVGAVCPSGFLPVAAGNVRVDSLVELYREAPLFRRIRDKDALQGKCGACEFRYLCGGSRARAWAVEGDWMASDPFCAHVPEAWRERQEAAAAG